MRVYLLESDGFYKIGVANNVCNRVSQLQIGNPYKINTVICSSELSKEMAFSVERTLHRILSSSNVSGEWFSLGDTEYSLVINFFTAESRGDAKALRINLKEFKEYMSSGVMPESEK